MCARGTNPRFARRAQSPPRAATARDSGHAAARALRGTFDSRISVG
ncbi:hypothetical protein AAULH_14326, partial [Lactobacillus helveticus MTCC 5463]